MLDFADVGKTSCDLVVGTDGGRSEVSSHVSKEKGREEGWMMEFMGATGFPCHFKGGDFGLDELL
jgi:hypothetical protein